MSITRRRTLSSIRSHFLEHGVSQNDEDSSSTGTVQRHPRRTLSCESNETEKRLLTVRNRNQSDILSLSSSNSGRGQTCNDTRPSSSCRSTAKENIEPAVLEGSKSISALDDSGTGFKAATSPKSSSQRIDATPERKGKWVDIHPRQQNPLQKWVKTLHRRHVMKQMSVKPREERWYLDEFDGIPASRTSKDNSETGKGHKKSSSWSSSNFVTAVKSATVSLATMSIAATSKYQNSAVAKESDQGSRRSPSLDQSISGVAYSGQRALDEASIERACERRNIIQEILRTEESYVTDLRLLIDVYRTISARATTIDTSRIMRNINEILDLHEAILFSIRPILALSGGPGPQGLLQPPAPYSENSSRSQSTDASILKGDKIARPSGRRSLDINKKRRKLEDRVMSDPEDAAQVALAFNDLIGQFFVYEEYGSRYSSMLQQLALTEKVHDIDSYERGFEALANTIAPCSSRDANRKKCLTYRDLLVKPMQRVTKYPLLFSDLLRQTPVIDCPESCGEVEKTLYRLRETVDEINKATNDENAHAKIQRSWKLQDLLRFPETTPLPFALRSLGHAKLCGVLHVAYQTSSWVMGEYMLCALFKSCIVLATRHRSNEKKLSFDIAASISLANLEVQECDNGTGLQCYNALYSWKVVFEANQHLFEFILSSCSFQEEFQWRSMIRYHAEKETRGIHEDNPRGPEQYSIVIFKPPIRPLSEAFGGPGTLARRLSTRRPATVGPRTPSSQVVIRNTHSLKQSERFTSESSGIGRSQTVNSGPRVQVLVPRRLDRMRMEQDLAEVWTKELLPYPGMSSRGEKQLRASASTVMRRLSRATSNSFGKRSISFTGSLNSRCEDQLMEEDEDLSACLDARFGLCPSMEHPKGTAGSDVAWQVESLTTPGKSSRGRNSGHKDISKLQERDATDTVAADKERLRLRKKISTSLSLLRTISIEGMKAVFSSQKEATKDL